MNRSRRCMSFGAAAALSVAGTGAALTAAPVAGASGRTVALVPSGETSALVPATALETTGGLAAGGRTAVTSAVAGYKVVARSGITSFTAMMQVPTIACPSSGTYSAYLSSQVVGTFVSGGSFVHLACAAGTASYTGFVVYTTVTDGLRGFTVAPGNTLESQIVLRVVKGKTTVHTTITDRTTGVVTSKWVTYTGIATDTTGWDVVEHLGTTPVPPFSPSRWSGARSNGTTLRAAGATRSSMVQTGTLLVSASPLRPTGASFTTVFHTSA